MTIWIVRSVTVGTTISTKTARPKAIISRLSARKPKNPTTVTPDLNNTLASSAPIMMMNPPTTKMKKKVCSAASAVRVENSVDRNKRTEKRIIKDP
jgi:hypothetical protein